MPVVQGRFFLLFCPFTAGAERKRSMKLREKLTRQNNSVKLLLKKLKTHDTIVVAVSVAIALALCGGLIYLSTPVVTEAAKDEIDKTQRADNEATAKRLDELSEYLGEIDTLVSGNQDTLENYYKALEKEQSEKNNNTEKITDNVTEKVKLINNDISSLKEMLSATRQQIDQLKDSIGKGDKANSEKIERAISEITKELEKIEKEYGNSKNNTTNLIAELKKTINNNNSSLSEEMANSYKELLSKLSDTENNLNKINLEAFDSFTTDLNDLSSRLGGRLDAIDTDISSINDKLDDSNAILNGRVDELGKDMNDKVLHLGQNVDAVGDEMTGRLGDVEKSVNDYNDNISSLLGSLGGDVNVNLDSLKDYIGGEINGVNNRIDQFFTSVSNGKKLLASALLTKGVTVKEDATFGDIAKAIAELDTEYILDPESTSGKVVYEYHYHKDGEGNTLDAAYAEPRLEGGCYTIPYHHHHSDACYKTETIYTYSTAHNVTNKGTTGKLEDGHTQYKYHCNYCGKNFNSSDPSHTESTNSLSVMSSRKGKLLRSKVNTELICEHEEDELLGYLPSCGYLHGQVVSAHISFKGKYSEHDKDIDPIAPSVKSAAPPAVFIVPADENEGTEPSSEGSESSGNSGSSRDSGSSTDSGTPGNASTSGSSGSPENSDPSKGSGTSSESNFSNDSGSPEGSDSETATPEDDAAAGSAASSDAAEAAESSD